MVASEAVPFAKSGGLGDVTGSLPRALAALGHDATLVIPRYRGIAVPATPALRFDVALGGRVFETAVFEQVLGPGFRVWFIDQPGFFDREHLYGRGNEDYSDNAQRFAYLSLSALQATVESRFTPDIVHAHDWQTGLVPVYARTRFADTSVAKAGTVFTIHNLAYQGLTDAALMPELNLGRELFDVEALEYWGKVSLLKGGINFSDQLTTVSPRYAREIQTAESGCGFDGIVRRRAGHLTGILNGIDTDRWDPARDPYLAHRYSAETLDEKRHAKRAVLERFRLPVNDQVLARPLVGMVTRMVDQKGMDLLASLASELPRLGPTFVVHGTGERRYEDMWRNLAHLSPERIGTEIGYEEGLAHLIHAGSDIWLMPSRFEPCGLNQLYCQRYGTIPVVRATGGLDDTVENFDPMTGRGTGFKFHAAEPHALLDTLRWALSVYGNRDVWRRLQLAGMKKDFSWPEAASRYAEVYAHARRARN